MKKIFTIFSSVLVLAAVSSCEMFKLDNYDGPDAEVKGKLIDSKTGETLQLELSQTATWSWTTWSYQYTTVGAMIVQEQGWDKVADQTWYPRWNGEYQNKRVFAGDYVFTTKSLPAYLKEESFTLKKGKNEVDFQVTPFARIRNEKFTYDGRYIIAEFDAELGDPSQATGLSAVQLLVYTNPFVGTNYNYAKSDSNAKISGGWSTFAPGHFTLKIDTQLAANAEEFKYTRTHYVRIAALSPNTNSSYNFSDVYEISPDFKTVTKHDWTIEE